MPNTKNAEKALRKSKKKKLKNMGVKRRLKASIKDTERAIASGAGGVHEKLRSTVSAIDKAQKIGIIKKNNASRRKSRLMSTLAVSTKSKE